MPNYTDKEIADFFGGNISVSGMASAMGKSEDAVRQWFSDTTPPPAPSNPLREMDSGPVANTDPNSAIYGPTYATTSGPPATTTYTPRPGVEQDPAAIAQAQGIADLAAPAPPVQPPPAAVTPPAVVTPQPEINPLVKSAIEAFTKGVGIEKLAADNATSVDELIKKFADAGIRVQQTPSNQVENEMDTQYLPATPDVAYQMVSLAPDLYGTDPKYTGVAVDSPEGKLLSAAKLYLPAGLKHSEEVQALLTQANIPADIQQKVMQAVSGEQEFQNRSHTAGRQSIQGGIKQGLLMAATMGAAQYFAPATIGNTGFTGEELGSFGGGEILPPSPSPLTFADAGTGTMTDFVPGGGDLPNINPGDFGIDPSTPFEGPSSWDPTQGTNPFDLSPPVTPPPVIPPGYTPPPGSFNETMVTPTGSPDFLPPAATPGVLDTIMKLADTKAGSAAITGGLQVLGGIGAAQLNQTTMEKKAALDKENAIALKKFATEQSAANRYQGILGVRPNPNAGPLKYRTGGNVFAPGGGLIMGGRR